MTAELRERVVLVRLTPPQYVEMVAAGHLSRRDRDVLLAIAKRAHFQSWRWGEGAYRCAERIAGDIGYSERSVRYAYKSLVAGGWLDISPRPGRTNIFTVLRPVEPFPLAVDDDDEPGDDVGDNRPPDDVVTTADFAGGAATVAADLDPPPTEPAPEAPNRARGESDGAVAPAQPAPQWRRDGPPAASAGGPPPPAEHRARPHRQDAGRPRPSAAPPPSLAVAAVEPNASLSAADATGEPIRWSRRVTRLQRCPRCGAAPGDACRNRAGRLRKANHAERRTPPPPRLG